MEKMTHYPLHAQEDVLKRSLILNGFTLEDDGEAPEIESADWAIRLFKRPGAPVPVYLEDGDYVLRSEVIAAQLPSLGKSPLPIKKFSAGRVYDHSDAALPCHSCIEGVWAAQDLPLRDIRLFWQQVALTAYGLDAETTLEPQGDGSYEVKVQQAASFTLARMGEATSIARALLGLDDTTACWIFVIDVDAVTVALDGFSNRAELYSPNVSYLVRFTDNEATFGNPFYARAVDELRKLGFHEFSGLKIYESDCYKKMNMIQEAWDTNNRGVQLVEPLGNYTGLPTVLTPALEEALAENYAAGEETCRIFEIGHIFLPGNGSAAPMEKRSISFDAYGPDLDKKAWRTLVGEFLDNIGIKNHFFMPLPPGQAPAYDENDGWIVMDQNMRYLESNFGSISPVALENHGIGVPAFMAQFEYYPIIEKAVEEFRCVPHEYE